MAKKDTAVKPTVEKVEVHRAQPQVHTFVSQDHSDMAVLVNTKTGKRTPMSRQYAERRQRKNPATYKVI